MHSVDLLEEALRICMNLGFQIRQEWLKEQGGGACRIGGHWVVFVDLSVSTQEQLESVVRGLRSSGQYRHDETISSELRALLSGEESSQLATNRVV